MLLINRVGHMPPTSDGDSVCTVGCALDKLVPDPVHLRKIRDAVATTHTRKRSLRASCSTYTSEERLIMTLPST